MRHATDSDLDRLEPLLDQLRAIPELRERNRGSFSRGSKAFLHFHAANEELYVDVRLSDSFERMPVTTASEQETFLDAVRRSVSSAG